MAITIVASVFATSNNGGKVTLVWADGQEGDVAVTWGGFSGGTACIAGVISPDGYTSIWSNDSAALDTNLAWKRFGATPDPSVLLMGPGDASDATGYAGYLLRGVTNAVDPLDVPITTSIATGVPNAPSIITVTDGAMVMAFGVNDINDTSPGTLTKFSANMGGSSNDTDDQTVAAAASIIQTAGSIYPSVWTTWASGVYNTATVALRPAVAPTVTTSVVSEITITTATGGGNVTADGGSGITERGVAWGLSASPTTPTAQTAGTTGFYQSSITGLSGSTHYFARAYAINAIGTGYGSDVEFDTLAGGSTPVTQFEFAGAFSPLPPNIRNNPMR